MTKARESASGISLRRNETFIDVGLVDDTERKYPHRSRIDFLNNQVDTKTATITMRGRLDNPHSSDPAESRPPLFRPGMFARVRLPLGDAVERLFVPEPAVGSNQDRKILWVVGPDDVAATRELQVGQKLGTWVAVSAVDPTRPLTATDRVVIRGLQRCREGKPVRPVTAAEEELDRAGLLAPAPPREQPTVPDHIPTPSASTPPPPPPDAARPAAAEPLPAPGEAAP